MTIKYEISRWSSMFSQTARDYVVCHKAPRAKRELWRMIYEMLKSDGLLDRPVAHRLLREFEGAEICPPSFGCYRHQTFYLRQNDGAHGPFVEFKAWRA